MSDTNAQSHGDSFEQVMQSVRQIKKDFVDNRIDFYNTHTKIPQFMFRASGIALILLSVCLPALAALSFPGKNYWLSGVSVVIAALTGVSSFYRWERTWRGNSAAQVALEQHVAKWELELTNARLIVPAADRIKHVYDATDELLTNTRTAVGAENEGFFSGLQTAQQTNAKGS